jgi:glycerol-3-phosphate dehydrogenase (NAD(P)+)
VYRNPDRLGLELGGALKNVIAIAAGLSDGLGFGDNAKAGLVTRGAVEIRRLGVACGARAETFGGLGGLGDLMVTCFSRLSRNRTLGERLGRGERLADVLASTPSIAEGVPTSAAAARLADRLGVEAPIIREVEAMLHHGKDVAQAVQDLLARDSKAED